MTDNITVSRELLRQVLNAACSPYCAQDLGKLMPAIIAALEQPAVQPEKLGSEWVPCMKLPVVVHVRNQRDGERHVSTREGITPVKPDDLIMRGVSGEEYPIGRAIFDQTYTFDIAAQLAPVQEPVAWASQTALDIAAEGGEGIIVGAEADCLIPLYTVPQPVPVQEPSHDVVAGAIFDFAGFLTSHKVMIEVGSCSNASPMVERIKEWSGNRGLSLENPDVFGWQMRTAQPHKAVKLSDEVERLQQQLAIYEKHGVTCQTFGHKLTGCAECNRDDDADMALDTLKLQARQYFELLPEMERLSADAAAYRALNAELDKQMRGSDD